MPREKTRQELIYSVQQRREEEFEKEEAEKKRQRRERRRSRRIERESLSGSEGFIQGEGSNEWLIWGEKRLLSYLSDLTWKISRRIAIRCIFYAAVGCIKSHANESFVSPEMQLRSPPTIIAKIADFSTKILANPLENFENLIILETA